MIKVKNNEVIFTGKDSLRIQTIANTMGVTPQEALNIALKNYIKYQKAEGRKK